MREIQISTELEHKILKELYDAVMTGNYHRLRDAAKKVGKRFERVLEAIETYENYVMSENRIELKNRQKYVIILRPPKVVEIILVSKDMEC